MEITSKSYGTPKYKTWKLCDWKSRGVKHDDFDALFEEYINTTECQHCAKPFKSTYDRCLDHDHTTGLFRKIVCQKCNNMDYYIKYPDGKDVERYNRERLKEYFQKNKEKIKARTGQQITCDCGSVVAKMSISRHKRSMKHMNCVNTAGD